MPINKGDEVKIHYTAKLENGEIIETTRAREPLNSKIGSQRLLPSLEEALIGLEKGDKKVITVPPSKGFGERREDLLREMPKSMFGKGPKPAPGTVIEVRYEDGNRRLATIHDVREDSIVLDLNHPLAGETLTFDIEVIDVT